MTSRYRVEYALKSHRRDTLIEWMKGLTAVPFVLHAGSVNYFKAGDDSKSSAEARRKYAEIFKDVEGLIEQHMESDNKNSRLRQMVPSVGHFFTALPLERAFYVQDEKRAISKRRMVAPSFNDIRMILNTAQIMAMAGNQNNRVKLMTFDGDVTLYNDGGSLRKNDRISRQLIELIRRGIYVGIVTAAGYPDGHLYYERLEGLIQNLIEDPLLTPEEKSRLLIMGGECNYLFQFDGHTNTLKKVERELWATDSMLNWKGEDCDAFMDEAEQVLGQLAIRLGLEKVSEIIRKDRSVGIVPLKDKHIPREDLEEIVLNVSNILQYSECASRVYFCAFNGGSDVWVDIGDKRYGVLSLQKYLGDIDNKQTLHVGDQFASIGANDFKARLVASTIWVCCPRETADVLEEFFGYLDEHKLNRISLLTR